MLPAKQAGSSPNALPALAQSPCGALVTTEGAGPSVLAEVHGPAARLPAC